MQKKSVLNGKEINLTSDNTIIKSTNFNVDKNGNVTCKNATVTGGNINMSDNGLGAYEGKIRITGDTYANGIYSDGLVIRKKNSSTHSTSANSIFLHMYEDQPSLIMTGTNVRILSVNNKGFDFISDNEKGFSCDKNGYLYSSNISSDIKLKKNIKTSTTNGLDIIKQMKHKQFEMKSDNKHYNIGYIAQEMEKIDPNFVLIREKTENEEERYYINELPIIATATKAIQEQQEQIEQLQEKDKQKDKIIQDLIKRIEALEKGASK